MSIKAMSYIWEHSEQKGSKLLALLAIADRCDDEGVCYPGHNRLAKKARISKQAIAKNIKALEEAGELSVTIHGGIKTTHGNTNKYYLTKYRDSLELVTPDGNRSEYVQYDGVSKRIPQGIYKDIPQEVYESISYPLVDPSVDTSDKDIVGAKTADVTLTCNQCNQTYPLDMAAKDSNGDYYCRYCELKSLRLPKQNADGEVWVEVWEGDEPTPCDICRGDIKSGEKFYPTIASGEYLCEKCHVKQTTDAQNADGEFEYEGKAITMDVIERLQGIRDGSDGDYDIDTSDSFTYYYRWNVKANKRELTNTGITLLAAYDEMQGANADGIELDTDGRLTEESWRKIDGDGDDLTYRQKILLGNIYHCPLERDHPILKDTKIKKDLDFLAELEYVWMNNDKTHYIIGTDGGSLMEAWKQENTDDTPQPATVADLVAADILELDAAIYDGVPSEHVNPVTIDDSLNEDQNKQLAVAHVYGYVAVSKANREHCELLADKGLLKSKRHSKGKISKYELTPVAEQLCRKPGDDLDKWIKVHTGIKDAREQNKKKAASKPRRKNGKTPPDISTMPEIIDIAEQLCEIHFSTNYKQLTDENKLTIVKLSRTYRNQGAETGEQIRAIHDHYRSTDWYENASPFGFTKNMRIPQALAIIAGKAKQGIKQQDKPFIVEEIEE